MRSPWLLEDGDDRRNVLEAMASRKAKSAAHRAEVSADGSRVASTRSSTSLPTALLGNRLPQGPLSRELHGDQRHGLQEQHRMMRRRRRRLRKLTDGHCVVNRRRSRMERFPQRVTARFPSR